MNNNNANKFFEHLAETAQHLEHEFLLKEIQQKNKRRMNLINCFVIDAQEPFEKDGVWYQTVTMESYGIKSTDTRRIKKCMPLKKGDVILC